MRWQGLIGVGLLIVSGITSGQKVRGMGRVMAFGNTTPIDIELPDVGQDMEVDPVRQLLYVSVPARNEIVVISLNSLTIVDLLFVGNRPHGIDLSADGRTLYAALHQATSVAYLDLESGLVSDTIVLGDLLGHSTTWDVVEGQPDRIFVSANPSSGGFAYIVQIDRAAGNALRRVAGQRIIRCAPTFAASPDMSSVYVGECFSPESLYKLSLSTIEAPIVLEDNHGSVSGTSHLEVSPDGARIYLRSGQILRTSDFTQIGSIGAGPSRLNAEGSLAYVAATANRIDLYDTTTRLKVGELAVPCAPSGFGTGMMLVLPDDRGLVTLSGGRICGQLFGEVFSLAVGPGSEDFVTTQVFDAVLRVDPGNQRITSLSATLDGARVPGDKLIAGSTQEGETTLRLPDVRLDRPGDHRFEVELRLANGAELTAVAEWHSIATRETSTGLGTKK